MKQNMRWLAFAVVYGVALWSARAQDTRYYIRGGVGGSWMPDTSLKEFFGPVTPGSKVSFDPGARVTVAGGYEFTDWFAGEVETGVMVNGIDTVTDATRVDDATFSNIPFLLNARFQWPTRCPFTPYIGGGLGGAASVIDVDHLDVGGTSLQGSQATAVFAYQAFGGIRYRINERMGLSVEYRYFATTDPEWTADAVAGTPTDTLKMGGIENHSVSLVFNYQF